MPSSKRSRKKPASSASPCVPAPSASSPAANAVPAGRSHHDKFSTRLLAGKATAKKAKDEAAKRRQNAGVGVGAIVCAAGLFLMLTPAPPPEGLGMGPPPERPVPQAPDISFHTPALDPTQRAAVAPTLDELAAVEAAETDLIARLAEEDGIGGNGDGDRAALTPAERAAARKARKAAQKKRDNRAAGFGGSGGGGGGGADAAASGVGDRGGRPLTLNDDPRFRHQPIEVDLRRQAQFAGMWSPQEACPTALDLECPAVHRLAHKELPDPITFECAVSADCNDYPCVDSQCVCGGTAVGTDCGSVRMLAYEWRQSGASKKGGKSPAEAAAAEGRAGVPSVAAFHKLLRGATPQQALTQVLNSFALVQDPTQSEMDAAVQAKLRPELEFLLQATMETSPDGAVDFLPDLVEEALQTTLQTTIWLSKNIVRFVPMPRALRLGVQEHGAAWFFDELAEVLRWTSHPAAAPIDWTRVSTKHPGHTLLSLATHWQLYPAMQLLLQQQGGAVVGAMQYAVANHDLTALKILLEAGLDPKADGERDAFGRSPLELARLAQDASFDNVLGHLEAIVGDGNGSAAAGAAASAPARKKRRRKDDAAAAAAATASDGAEQQTQQRRGLGDTGGVFFERAGTDVQLNCGVDVVAAADLTAERFLRDYAVPGRPLIMEGAADDWGMATFKIATFPDELGEADVAANQIPYGDQVGVDSHGMKLKDFLGYMRTLSPRAEELPLHVFDTNFLDSPGMANMDYRPGSQGSGEGGDVFYHHSRYPWAGGGALADAMNALSPTEDTMRWPHFFVGPRDAGGGFQTHCSLFTTVTDGKQLWMAYPPSQPAFGSSISREHPIEWMREVNQHSPEVLQGSGPHLSNPMTCILRPGYTMYTPPHWTSSSINLEPTMGVTFEVLNNCIV